MVKSQFIRLTMIILKIDLNSNINITKILPLYRLIKHIFKFIFIFSNLKYLFIFLKNLFCFKILWTVYIIYFKKFDFLNKTNKKVVLRTFCVIKEIW